MPSRKASSSTWKLTSSCPPPRRQDIVDRRSTSEASQGEAIQPGERAGRRWARLKHLDRYSANEHFEMAGHRLPT